MKSVDHSVLNLTLAGVLSAFIAGSAFAAPVAPSFKTYDSNGDSLISQKEFMAGGGQEQAFREGDANLDYHLNNDEFIKANAYNDRIKTGKYVDDAWITTKVKALLLKDEGVKGLDVKVETHQGTVQLSGWVSNATQAAQAEKVALSVEGVTGIKNDLQIKR